MELDLEDLAFPATLRGIDPSGEPGDHVRVNQAFLDFYGSTTAPSAPAGFVGDSSRGPDELDRRVAAGAGPLTHDLRWRGRTLALQKSPIRRNGAVVAVLTVLTEVAEPAGDTVGPAPLGWIADTSQEAITLLEHGPDGITVVSRNRAGHGLDRLIDGLDPSSATSVRAELESFAERAIASGVPEVDDIAVGDRHFTVRSELVDDVDRRHDLLTQTVVDVSDRWRSTWLERLVDVAAMPTVAAAAKLAFAIVDDALGLDRGALMRFDGQLVDVFATTASIDVDRRLQVSDRLIDATSMPGVLELRHGDDIDDDLLGELGLSEATAIALHVDDRPWGLLVVGAAGPAERPLTALTRSMLDALGATLATLIERDRARQRLQESNRRLEAYAHAAAHDLRSPLRRIRSFAQILQARLGVEEIDRDQLSDFADRIARGAARLDTLLESMLEHANISALAEESTEYTDLQALAESITSGIVELSQDPKPTFNVVDLPEVRLPHDAAERVLRNLIDNSLKYAARDRTVVVDLRGEPFDGGVRVRVHDNGIGIEPQFADKVFQLFNQLRNDTSGSGVGLAVVERLLSTRGARIWVESEAGSGATFVIEFPSDVLRSGAGAI